MAGPATRRGGGHAVDDPVGQRDHDNAQRDDGSASDHCGGGARADRSGDRGAGGPPPLEHCELGEEHPAADRADRDDVNGDQRGLAHARRQLAERRLRGRLRATWAAGHNERDSCAEQDCRCPVEAREHLLLPADAAVARQEGIEDNAEAARRRDQGERCQRERSSGERDFAADVERDASPQAPSAPERLVALHLRGILLDEDADV